MLLIQAVRLGIFSSVSVHSPERLRLAGLLGVKYLVSQCWSSEECFLTTVVRFLRQELTDSKR